MRLAFTAPQRETVGEILTGVAVAFGESGDARGILTRSGRLLPRVIVCGMVSRVDRERGIFTMDDGTGEIGVSVAGELRRQALAEVQEGDFVQALGKPRRLRVGGAILVDANIRKYNHCKPELLARHASEIERQRKKDAYLLGVATELLEKSDWNYLRAKTLMHSKPLRPERRKGLCARHLRAAQAARRRL